MKEAEDGENVGIATEEVGDGEEQSKWLKNLKATKQGSPTMRKSTRKRGAPKKY